MLFLDESGDHSLQVIDNQYPLFVLGGVIADVGYAKGEMTERLSDFKRKLLGTDQLILHTADMVRNRNGFEALAHPEFRGRFYAGLNSLLAELQYQIVACVIRKDVHLQRYGDLARDPYHFALEVLVERLCYEVGDNPRAGMIVAERRNRFLDRQLRLAWLTLKAGGTRFVQAVQVARRNQRHGDTRQRGQHCWSTGGGPRRYSDRPRGARKDIADRPRDPAVQIQVRLAGSSRRGGPCRASKKLKSQDPLTQFPAPG